MMLTLACSMLLIGGARVTTAFAAGPWWKLDARAAPTNLPPGGEGQIVLTATNIGDADTTGTVTLSDKVPVGVEPRLAQGQVGAGAHHGQGAMTCPSEAELKAKYEASKSAGVPTEVSCQFSEPLFAYEELELAIHVDVVALADGATTVNEATATGGGAAPASLPPAGQRLVVNSAAPPFGVEKVEMTPEEEGGATDKQAGSHPFQLTTSLDFNQVITTELTGEHEGKHAPVRASPQLLKDIQTDVPPGLIGSASATPRCSGHDFTTKIGVLSENACEADTAIGVSEVEFFLKEAVESQTVPVFNLVPAQGEPARFGIDFQNVTVVLDTSIETGGTYRVEVTVKEASQSAYILGTKIVLWGEPGDVRHDLSRGWKCLARLLHREQTCEAPEPRSKEPFLSLPTSCTEPLTTTVYADSWKEPGRRLPDGRIDTSDPNWKSQESTTEHLEGCEALPFSPSLTVAPLTQEGSTPTGLKVDVHVPQLETTRKPQGKAESAVRATTVALPEGMNLSPTSASGLQACSLGQIGFERVDPNTGADQFTPAPATCPEQSKVATVRITSPDLPCRDPAVATCRSEEEEVSPGVSAPEEHEELVGAAYLAAPQNFAAPPQENPFESLVALYIVAESPESHVRVKLAGRVTPNEGTGQLVSTFENTPQVPFGHFELNFLGGHRGNVSTPALCGNYTTGASLSPWSGNAAVPAPSSFAITSGPGGSGCSPNPQALSPGFQAGSTSPQAAGFTAFTVDIERPDADQAIRTVTTHLPPGIAGMLSSVTLCQEPQASQGTCPGASLVGHTTVTSGLGPEPFTPPVGQVFITGPYKGAPFGLTIVTPAIAGPFNLGNVIVRARIDIDRSTAAITVTSDPVPLMLRGLALQLQHINVTVDRPGFQFNPTNCSPKAVTATIVGAQGGIANVSYPFQAKNCASLPFTPKLTATVGAQGSKANGVGFNVIVQSGGLGVSNLAKVNLQLPAILPSRLSTIQKACRDTIFEVNPATCPEGSVIGKAIIHTPVLKNPLTGPAYLVSHGNAAFPDVEFLLQGEGVTLLLDGKTDIKKGVTYSHFESNPDDPFTTFETQLPAGPHSALTDFVPASKNFNLCGQTLLMPTELTAENGLLIKQTTHIAIVGCKKPLTRAQLLARALKACKKLKKKKRASCVASAQRKYGAKKGKGAKKKHGH
jgi:hypothetical protein